MSQAFNLFEQILDLALYDDRVALLLRNASSGEDFAKSIRIDGAAQRRARNAALICAANLLIPDKCDPWVRSKKLAEAVRRFGEYTWPRLKNGAQIELTPHERYLCRAFLADKNVPEDPRYLYRALFK